MNFTAKHRPESPAVGYAIRRRRALQRVDRELSKGNFKDALSLVKQLQGKPFGLRGFGAARQVPRNRSVVDKLEFDGVKLSPFRALVDAVMDSIESPHQVDDERTEYSREEDHLLCLQHEAGHFLVGYLLGALPKRYRITSIEELKDGNFAGGKVQFLGFEFLRLVGVYRMTDMNDVKGRTSRKGNRGTLSSKTINNFSCITLGGMVVEHMIYGNSRGHYNDIDKMHTTFKWLNFTEIEARNQARWAAVNTIFVLNQYQQARKELVKAMANGQSVGSCIDAIEKAIEEDDAQSVH